MVNTKTMIGIGPQVAVSLLDRTKGRREQDSDPRREQCRGEPPRQVQRAAAEQDIS